MLSNKRWALWLMALWLMALWLITSAAAYAGNAELECPPTHNGKSLKDVGGYSMVIRSIRAN